MKNIELAPPTAMSAAARAAEITAILESTITRSLLAVDVAPEPNIREVSLGLSGHQRVHTTPYEPENL